RRKHLCIFRQETPTRVIAAPIPQCRENWISNLHHSARWACQPKSCSLTTENHRVIAQRQANWSQQLECLKLAHARLYVEQQVAQTLRAVGSGEFKGGQLIDVTDCTQAMFRFHEYLPGVQHFTAHSPQCIDKVCRYFKPVIWHRGFNRGKILPAGDTY